MILILTVGTGTAGQHSNLAAGLLNSINSLKVGPSFVLLVPSTNEESTSLAELITEECPFPSELASFEQRIQEPDDLLCARSQIRACIELVNKRFPGQSILVNPTSGTKQMTIGCFLAASEIPGVEISFISGQRKDGVVITGTEQNLRFEPNLLHRERALATAETLYASGALEAIHPLLDEFGEPTQPESMLGLCQSHRQSLRFELARQAASRADHPSLIPLRSYFEKIKDAGRNSALFVAEVFAGAERLRKWGKDTSAFLSYYQSVEFAARTALATRHHLEEPFDIELIANAPYFSPSQTKRFRAHARDGEIHLGMHGLHETLVAFGDKSASSYLEKDSMLRTLLNRRNEFIHSGITPDPKLISALAGHTRAHLFDILPQIDLDRPIKLWPEQLSAS